MAYRQGPAMREHVSAEVGKILKAGIIELSTSEWASPIVLARKKDRSLGFSVPYRQLNAKKVGDAYPLPRIDDCLDSLGDAARVTTVDCKAGYWQIPMAAADMDKTTFTTFLSTCRQNLIPFELINAPATFQRTLDIILAGLPWQVCRIYLDDVVVFSKDVASHMRDVDQVFDLLQKAGVTLKLRKCSFLQPKVDYLGYEISSGKLEVTMKNTEAF